jgi:uncharacterized membrane protein
MSDSDTPDLEARVARLERMLERLMTDRGVAAGTRGASGPNRSRPPERPVPPPASVFHPPERSVPPPASASTTAEPLAGFGERWLGRVGIAFIILAVAFLLKLSFDRGWVTPAVRLGAGMALGAGLLVAGLRLDATRRTLAQSLMGGAIALFYLVGFAGFQLYELLSFPAAMSLMTTTTILSFVLADGQDSPPLAVIGVSGGLSTPFLLSTGSANTVGLSIYVALVLVGGGAVHFRRGWLSLLVVMAFGGASALLPLGLVSLDEVLIPSLAVLVYLVVCVALPLARPALWPGPARENTFERTLWITRLATVTAMVVGVGILAMVLELTRIQAGVPYLVVGLAAGLGAWAAPAVPLTRRPTSEVAALAVALGLALVGGDSLALLLVMGEVAALLMLVERGAPSGLAKLAHFFTGVALLSFLFFAANAPPGAMGFREDALLRLGVLAMVALCAMLAEKDLAPLYGGLAYVGLLVWFVSELGSRPNGTALVSIAWGMQGALTLLVALSTRSSAAQIGGLLTLGLVAAKLLVVDLAQLDAVWRILIFLGFGGGLLGLAYLVNRPKAAARATGDPGGD